jgi:hypothetical protein
MKVMAPILGALSGAGYLPFRGLVFGRCIVGGRIFSEWVSVDSIPPVLKF